MYKSCGGPNQGIKRIKLYFDGTVILPAKDVTKTLSSLSGVQHVKLHFFTRKVDIEFNPSITPLSDIISVLSAKKFYSRLTIMLV